MLRSYLKTGIRHLLRNKMGALINIGGLALGISVAILIGLWVHDELTFDYYHQNHGRLAQVYKGTGQKWLPYPLGLELQRSYHHSFRNIAIANPAYDHILAAGTGQFSATGQFVEPVLPAMLTLEMVEGSQSGLTDTYSILLAESAARSFFGDEIGKTNA